MEPAHVLSSVFFFAVMTPVASVNYSPAEYTADGGDDERNGGVGMERVSVVALTSSTIPYRENLWPDGRVYYDILQPVDDIWLSNPADGECDPGKVRAHELIDRLTQTV
ncbi:hypothetical protein HPB52_002919 [Rhipicephalus sanguineus]|uniref:Uncharacterized protein n=1 Tax=Rhipicephalus sanguineus TaxID=34632 RepID=A0A9D4PHP4_RHISA|nr:hypothetical protein HPB52_002919 [Rhipicephalus sanguineus]